jgi:hypothetical protein
MNIKTIYALAGANFKRPQYNFEQFSIKIYYNSLMTTPLAGIPETSLDSTSIIEEIRKYVIKLQNP